MSFLLKDFLLCEFLQTCLFIWLWSLKDTGLIAEIFIHIFSGNITMTSVLQPYNIWAAVEFIPVTEPFLPFNSLWTSGNIQQSTKNEKADDKKFAITRLLRNKICRETALYWSSKYSVLCFSCSSFSMAVRIQVEKFVRNFLINVATDYTLTMLVENCTREPSCKS